MTRLSGAHLLVTGGSSGIGLAVAEQAIDRGARVSIVARDAERLERVQTQLEARGVGARVAHASADVADAPALRAAIGGLVARFGPVDVLVTCAGFARPGHFLELDDEVFRAHMDVDYFGTLHAVRAVLPSMVERRRGHLVLVSSTTVLVGVYGYSAYSPAKHAVRGLAETLRPELKPHGIVVSCVYPPDTDTPGLAQENEHKPGPTRKISAMIKPRTAVEVGTGIIRGIERNRRTITAEWQTAALARIGGLIAPVLNPVLDRHLPDD